MSWRPQEDKPQNDALSVHRSNLSSTLLLRFLHSDLCRGSHCFSRRWFSDNQEQTCLYNTTQPGWRRRRRRWPDHFWLSRTSCSQRGCRVGGLIPSSQENVSVLQRAKLRLLFSSSLELRAADEWCRQQETISGLGQVEKYSSQVIGFPR